MKTTLNYMVGLCAIVLMFTAAPVLLLAQNGLSVGLKAGTTGLGLEGATNVINKVNIRLGGGYYGQTITGSSREGDVSIGYNADLSLTSIPLLIDYYPAGRGFHLTAGLHYQDFSINGGASPNEDYRMNNKTFTPEKMGSLDANLEYSSTLAPYMGFGFGNALAPGSRLTFMLDLGALYTDAPKLTMSGEGMIAPTASQASDFQEGLNEFKWYPVLNLGLSYRIMDRN